MRPRRGKSAAVERRCSDPDRQPVAIAVLGVQHELQLQRVLRPHHVREAGEKFRRVVVFVVPLLRPFRRTHVGDEPVTEVVGQLKALRFSGPFPCNQKLFFPAPSDCPTMVAAALAIPQEGSSANNTTRIAMV